MDKSHRDIYDALNRYDALSPEEQKAIFDACLDDSAKIISYLEKEKANQRPRELFLSIVTVAGAIGSVVAAVTGIILLFK